MGAIKSKNAVSLKVLYTMFKYYIVLRRHSVFYTTKCKKRTFKYTNRFICFLVLNFHRIVISAFNRLQYKP